MYKCPEASGFGDLENGMSFGVSQFYVKMGGGSDGEAMGGIGSGQTLSSCVQS